jgi:hypothetical protein
MPARLDYFYGTRVCTVDADGNEVVGVRLPPIAVPLGTYTGWNVYRAQPCELCDRDGSLIPFARTRTERDAAGDPRPGSALACSEAADELLSTDDIASRAIAAKGFEPTRSCAQRSANRSTPRKPKLFGSNCRN